MPKALASVSTLSPTTLAPKCIIDGYVLEDEEDYVVINEQSQIKVPGISPLAFTATIVKSVQQETLYLIPVVQRMITLSYSVENFYSIQYVISV